MTQQVISANRLSDGLVVYLASDDSWSEWISRGEIATDEAAADGLLARAKLAEENRIVLDPYLVQVAEDDGEFRPTKYREFIRATGPSVRPDLSKQNFVREAKG
jgi:hypothetical protein